MAQNIFSGDATQFLPYVDQTNQGQPPVKKKAPANGTQTSGFGPSQIGGGAMGENQARPAPQFAPPAAITMPSAQGSGGYASPPISNPSAPQNHSDIQSPIQGFGDGYSHPMSDLHSESQARWQSHGIDFDSLLKQGIANSASGSSISRDLFQREKAAELNQRYIDAAQSQMHPQQIGRTQDIDLLKTLGITLESMPKVTAGPVDAHGKPTMVANPEYLSLQQNYHQLLSKLGLDQAQGQVHTTAPAGASPQGQTGQAGSAPQPNAANPNVQGFGGGVKSFLRGMAPTGGATAGWMGASKVAGMIPGPWGKAAQVVLPLIGAALGSKATTSAADAMMPDAQDAEAAHPWARMAGEATGFAPGVAQYMKNRSAAQQPQQQQQQQTQQPMAQPIENPVMEAQVNPTPTPTPQPQLQPTTIAGFSANMPATPKYNPNMGGVPKIKQPTKKPANP